MSFDKLVTDEGTYVINLKDNTISKVQSIQEGPVSKSCNEAACSTLPSVPENSHFVHSEEEGLRASSSKISSRSPVHLSQAVAGRIFSRSPVHLSQADAGRSSSCSPVRLSQVNAGRISPCSPIRLSQAVAGRIFSRSLVRLQSSGSKRQNLSPSDNSSVDDHGFTEPVDCAMDSTLPSNSGSIAANIWE
ncbi:hypothetical protein ACOMHN_018894 [Nucella lapillus]